MKQSLLAKKFKLTVYTAMIGLWVFSTIYSLSQNLQTSVDRFHTSSLTLRVIQAVISLPALFIYLAVAFSAITFAIYTQRINKSKEEAGYDEITNGLFLTLGYFVISGLAGLLQNRYDSGQAAVNFIIVKNYLYLLINLGIYWYFWRGSKALVSTLQQSKKKLMRQTYVVQFVVLAFTAAYTYLVFHNPYRTSSNVDTIKPTYGLPDGLIVFTIILPYAITWLLAAMAVVNFSFYSRNVSGLIFKQLFRNLARGFGLVIGFTIVLQILSQFTEYLSTTGLKSILVFISIIFLALVLAYLQIGVAASKLDRIETV